MLKKIQHTYDLVLTYLSAVLRYMRYKLYVGQRELHAQCVERIS